MRHRAVLVTTAAIAALSFTQHSFAGEVLISGWFNPGFDSGYQNHTNDAYFGDTSGAIFGTLVDFSNNALLPFPKTVSIDTPVYGEVTATYSIVSYITYTPAGEFYQYLSPTGGFLDVNIVLPGHGISSFSFETFATLPPPVIIPPPCMIDCGGITPPITGSAPEPSTWAMMFLGFIGLGFAARRNKTQRLSVAMSDTPTLRTI